MFEPPRISLANLPTPLLRLERLSRELGGAQIWMKRDDMTGVEFSGNKIRKLEYVAADAIAAGCDTIVTEGTSQSNHCRATAAVCAKLGLHAFLLFRPPPPGNGGSTGSAGAAGGPRGNHLLDVLFGAQTRSFDRPTYAANRERIIADVLEQLRATGQIPRFTPAGASEPLGCWGYIRAAAELGEQLRAAGIDECDVVTALSSGGTFGGLLLGKLLHWPAEWRLWAVPVSDDAAYHCREIASLCESAIIRYDLPVAFDAGTPLVGLAEGDGADETPQVGPARMRYIDGYVGEAYAIPYPEAIETIHVLARTEGIVLDPVYTAKAFTAVLDGVRDGRLGRKRPVVFLHSGGIFSNFAWPEVLLPSS